MNVLSTKIQYIEPNSWPKSFQLNCKLLGIIFGIFLGSALAIGDIHPSAPIEVFRPLSISKGMLLIRINSSQKKLFKKNETLSLVWKDRIVIGVLESLKKKCDDPCGDGQKDCYFIGKIRSKQGSFTSKPNLAIFGLKNIKRVSPLELKSPKQPKSSRLIAAQNKEPSIPPVYKRHKRKWFWKAAGKDSVLSITTLKGEERGPKIKLSQCSEFTHGRLTYLKCPKSISFLYDEEEAKPQLVFADSQDYDCPCEHSKLISEITTTDGRKFFVMLATFYYTRAIGLLSKNRRSWSYKYFPTFVSAICD